MYLPRHIEITIPLKKENNWLRYAPRFPKVKPQPTTGEKYIISSTS